MSEAPSKPRPKCLIVIGPSGVGKDTVLNKIINDPSGNYKYCVPHTTRAPRPGEEDGKNYFFISKEQFVADLKQGKITGWTEVHGAMYGTAISTIFGIIESGKVCVLTMDVKGATSAKQRGLKAYYLFIAPPSWEVLEARLRGRATESAEQLELRLEEAKKELQSLKEPSVFTHVVVNDDLDTCVAEINAIADLALAGVEPPTETQLPANMPAFD